MIDLSGIPNVAIIEKIVSYTDGDVKKGKFKDEHISFRLTIKTDKGVSVYEGCMNSVTIVYVVGKVDQDDDKRWEFQGVFDSEEKAVKECKDEFYFVGPVNMNGSYPGYSVEWPETYYPLKKVRHLNWNRLMVKK